MLYAALVALGGQAYLMRQAQENPRAFLTLLGKLLAAELRPVDARRSRRTGATSPAAPPPPAAAEQVPDAEEDPAGFLALLGQVLSAELRPAGRAADAAGQPAASAAPTITDELRTEGRTPVRPPGTRDLPVAPRQARQSDPTNGPPKPPSGPLPRRPWTPPASIRLR